MNPWALLLILIAVACLVVAVKGTQDNVISAAEGREYGSSTLGTVTPHGRVTYQP